MNIDPDAELFKHRFSPVIVLTTARADRKRLERLHRLADEVRICGEEEINFAEAFAWLKQKWKVNRLLCEGGGEVNDAILRAGLVDEIHLTVCPRIFGGTSAPTLADGTGFGQLKLARRFLVRVARRKGNEMFLVLQSVRLRV